MKKGLFLSCVFALGIHGIQAKPVTPATAQKLAENYYKQNTNAKVQAISLNLAFTEKTENGSAAYYVFNVNTNDGFVIVSGDDAAHPIIGYSTKSQFVVPNVLSPLYKWLKNRKKEIEVIQAKNISADETVANEWAGNFTHAASNQKANGNTSVSSVSIAPLCQTTRNQNGGGAVPYNDSCPGGSVTGCVATAMAQIMKYWNYPTHGTGSSSYCDCTTDSFTNTYGTLHANYGASTYNWANMPLTSSNIYVAQLMYDCGVSVNMDYAPSGSGAWVITADDSICAQRSYVKYFGYDPYTIQGLVRANYSDAIWISLLQNELINGRPVQYAGDDTSDGHTWVLDGIDLNNNFHMNWGWGGASDGYFSINNLATPGFNPSLYHEALIGIEPMPPHASDAGILSIKSPGTTLCNTTFSPSVTLQNFGTSILSTCVLNYSIDGNPVQIQNWSGSLNSGQSDLVSLPSLTVTAGTHTLTCYTSNPNGVTDSNTVNDQSIRFFTYGVHASFSANQTTLCFVPAPVQFTNTSVNASDYVWYFGDGTIDINSSPLHTYTTSGTYQVKLYASTCSGALADSQQVTVSINTPVAPIAVGGTTTCGSKMVLSATGNGTLVWDDALGNQLDTGATYTTPSLTATTTYYVSSTIQTAAITGAPAINTTLGAGAYLNAPHALYFDANAACVLQSVDIYVQNTNAKPIIQLLDNSGAVLNTLTPTIVASGKNTIALNWKINPGTGYQLAASGNSINLYRNALTSGKVPYPINIGSLVSITGDDADSAHYYWFYNWKVQSAPCSSPPVAVVAVAQNCSSAGIQTINEKGFELYPNPSRGDVTLRSTTSLGSVSVYNALGELVFEQKTNDVTIEIDLTKQVPGIYIVHVQNQFLRVIKQ